MLDYKNLLTFQVDGSYSPGDSWLGPGLYWEHRINKKWKVISGAGASLSWQDGDFFSGFAPSLRFKYDNRWSIGVNANLFTGLGTFFGIVAAYETTPTAKTWLETRQAKKVITKEIGSGNTDLSGVAISEKTIRKLLIEQEVVQ